MNLYHVKQQEIVRAVRLLAVLLSLLWLAACASTGSINGDLITAEEASAQGEQIKKKIEEDIIFPDLEKKTKELFKNKTYCQCSVEFNKQFFESAFEKPVEVELKQSIINGGDYCEFEIKWV